METIRENGKHEFMTGNGKHEFNTGHEKLELIRENGKQDS
jgi:hypothetical protein